MANFIPRDVQLLDELKSDLNPILEDLGYRIEELYLTIDKRYPECVHKENEKYRIVVMHLDADNMISESDFRVLKKLIPSELDRRRTSLKIGVDTEEKLLINFYEKYVDSFGFGLVDRGQYSVLETLSEGVKIIRTLEITADDVREITKEIMEAIKKIVPQEWNGDRIILNYKSKIERSRDLLVEYYSKEIEELGYFMGSGISLVKLYDENASEEDKEKTCIVVMLQPDLDDGIDPIPPHTLEEIKSLLPKKWEGYRVFVKYIGMVCAL